MRAIAEYTRGNALLLETKELDLSEHPKALSLFVANNLNLALAHLKLKQYHECVLFCDNVLHQEPNNVKALYRKGEALLAAGHRRDAVALFKQVIKVEPTNKAARQYVLRFEELDLDSLQDAIMKHLCYFLGPKDILSMRRVSKKLKRSMDAASMQILEGVARSRNLAISRSAKGVR
ncbi:CBN-FKB-6 protein [Aphelenchoides avenae]|nr:CBN-FKB-6 protein [Aphelenchus avenae]